MKLSIDLTEPSPPAWIEKVLGDFSSFMSDHADCERKASGMAMSFVAKFPDRTKIIPELIDIAIEELEHFRDIYRIMDQEKITLNHVIEKDPYIQELMLILRSGREERFLDRLLLASILECRGAERFKIVADHLVGGELKKFYKRLWTSEAKHGNVFVKFALEYFSEETVYPRLEEMMELEGAIIRRIPIRAALH